MSKIDKKYSKIWITLSNSVLSEQFKKDAKEWGNQSAYFMHIVTTYYKLIRKHDK